MWINEHAGCADLLTGAREIDSYHRSRAIGGHYSLSPDGEVTGAELSRVLHQ